MAAIHWVGGEKGGVGKSMVSRLLAQLLIDRNAAFRAFDSDASHPALLRYYASYSEPLSVHDFESLDGVVQAAVDEDRTVVVDLAAQSEHALLRWLNDSSVMELSDELGITLVRWHVMDGSKDSVKLLADLLAQHPENVPLVLVRNLGTGTDFRLLDASEALATAERRGATTVTLPALHRGTMSKIDRIDASFWSAANNTDASLGPCLNLLERQRVRTFLRRAYAEIEAARPELASSKTVRTADARTVSPNGVNGASTHPPH